MPIRLLALDADGTLLDSSGRLRPRIREVVDRCRARGLVVVLCTGRRFRTAAPVLRELRLEGAAVVQNGVLVKDAETGHTLRHRYLDRDLYQRALALWRSIGPPLLYVDGDGNGPDFYSEAEGTAHTFQQDYLDDNRGLAQIVPSLGQPPSDALVMLSCMADRESLETLRSVAHAELGDEIRTNFLINKSYRGHILEAVSAASGKWSALRWVAGERGISGDEILAIGDDSNDAEMIANAGVGVAMANAVPAALAAADWVTESNDDDGVAVALERFVLASA